jgi:uncharacterized membrane protein
MEDKINWKRKLSSRKFWMAVAALIAALYIFVTHDEDTAVQISSLVMLTGSVVAYIVAEGWTDANSFPSTIELDQSIDIPDDEEEE